MSNIHGLVLEAIQALNFSCHVYIKYISLKIWILGILVQKTLPGYLKLEFNHQSNLL